MVKPLPAHDRSFFMIDPDIKLIERELNRFPRTWVPYFYAEPRETLLGDAMGRAKTVPKKATGLLSLSEPLTKEDTESARLRLSWSQWRITTGYLSSQKKNEEGKTVYLIMKPTPKPREKRK